MQTNRPRILIADDHAMFAETLRLLLEKNYTIVGTVPDGRALLSATTKLNPDLIVLDVAMPLLNGFDAARRLREQFPKLKLVFLTMYEDPNMAAAALELGSVGFVLKHSAGSELLKAIEQVLRGFNYVTPRLKADHWVNKARAQQFFRNLNARQREVLQLCAEGRSIKEIAWELHLSEKTVEFHKHQIMHAHNLKSNAELVLFALDQRLITHNSKPRFAGTR
ncbi:MAG: response regulator [Acidobacteriaceae bacterium]